MKIIDDRYLDAENGLDPRDKAPIQMLITFASVWFRGET